MGTTPANILINLSSRLLCEGLQGIMRSSGCYVAHIGYDGGTDLAASFDLILVDVAALEEPRPARWDNTKVLLVDTGLAEEEIVRLLFTHKLDGVISTDTGSDLFLKALQTVLEGELWIDHLKLKAYLHNSFPMQTPAPLESFSKKEREILLLVAEGLKNREIASRLNMSEHTVKTHLGRIFKTANVSTRAQLVPLALKLKSATPLFPTA
ncbi:response regulator transcription factor [Geomonas sp. Red32]|uniref:helix-turn-helix transcriptional regulator n=1 Tax=Geomonas sp. Red32 TaxID=2912856 RepID=UPI00202D0BF0|nr:response regulator transcription factor [Geomonas sp. Red32]MCM0082948.1 response regulator transcription factor [Geomonas sp. Red32]